MKPACAIYHLPRPSINPERAAVRHVLREWVVKRRQTCYGLGVTGVDVSRRSIGTDRDSGREPVNLNGHQDDPSSPLVSTGTAGFLMR